MRAGKLRDRVEFQQRTNETGTLGGKSQNWVIQFNRACEFIHMRGVESLEGGRYAGREVYKVRLRSDAQVRALSTDSWRMRDTRRDLMFNITSIDAITDRGKVWLVVEQTQPSGTTYDTGGAPLPEPVGDGAFEDLPPLPD